MCLVSRCLYKINEPPRDIRPNELDANMVAHVEAFIAFDDFALSDGAGDSYPCTLVGSARDDPVELLANARGQQERGRGLS